MRGPSIQLKRKLYNKYAQIYEQRTKTYAQKFLTQDIKIFLENLPGKTILDLGSGPGRDSLIFKKRGFQPLCLDISEEMLKLCQKKGLKTIQVDFENLKLPPNSFGGVWSYTSLTTVPKEKVPKIISQIYKILKPMGLFYLGLIEGTFEGWKPPDQKYNLPRYQSTYQVKEVLDLCPQFELIYFRKIPKKETGRNTYLNFLFRRA